MKLKSWVEKEKNGGSVEVVYQRLSKETGLSARYLYFIALGESPGQKAAVKIVKATNGEVGLFDLLPHLKEAI